MTLHLRPLPTFAAIALAASFSASTATAVPITIMIEDWTVGQTVRAAEQGNPASGSVSGPEGSIIGGWRHMQVEAVNLDPPPDARQDGAVLNAEHGVVDFNTGAAHQGVGWSIYDGNASRAGGQEFATVAGLTFGSSMDPFTPAVHTDGLNADLLLGFPTGYFRFSAANFDHTDVGDLLFSAFAWDMDGRSVGYFEAIDPFAFDPILRYNQFRADWNNPGLGLAGFDWSRVGALAFRIESTIGAFDGQLGPITAHPIPLPASALLLLGGLGGLAGWSVAAKRRRRS